MTVQLRVLQVLADTDESAATRAGLSLHTILADAGLELRTVALAPGRRGEHAALIPVVAPGRRTLAALTQLHTESRWADVVVFHGTRAVPPGYRLWRQRPPALVVLQPDDRLRRGLRGATQQLHAVATGSESVAGRAATSLTVIEPDHEDDPSTWIGVLHEVSRR